MASSAASVPCRHDAYFIEWQIHYRRGLDQNKDTAAGFWRRASGFFASLGVRVGAVMTDNGACYRSRAFVEALGPGVKHR
ncbi:hypothetical protein [Corynebacterium auris]|uniref:hypothetical protein n=1 Tax=Corynebacterium auris TaxID=44750 RepID=UPI003F497992